MLSLKFFLNKQTSYTEYIITDVEVISKWKIDCGFDNCKCTPAATGSILLPVPGYVTTSCLQQGAIFLKTPTVQST